MKSSDHKGSCTGHTLDRISDPLKKPNMEHIRGDPLGVWGHRGTVTAVHRHAHRGCTVYQPSGFLGYPLTCAHLHPKPSERKRRDKKKTVKRTQVTGTEANVDGFDGRGGRERCTNSMF